MLKGVIILVLLLLQSSLPQAAPCRGGMDQETAMVKNRQVLKNPSPQPDSGCPSPQEHPLPLAAQEVLDEEPCTSQGVKPEVETPVYLLRSGALSAFPPNSRIPVPVVDITVPPPEI